MPDGTKKPVRRRVVVVKVVKKEEPVLYQEVDVDEENPEDNNYDPKVNKTVKFNSKKILWRNDIMNNIIHRIRKQA